MIVKFAAAQVLEAKVAQEGGGLMKGAHKASFDYDPRPGYLYVRSRAISSRINDNFDEFPADEIKEAYRTFIGKPVFVNHHNENHRRARGVIVDAALHEDRVPKTGEVDTWVEVLMEVDAVKFPKLAQAIMAGEIDRTSMGCDVKASQCSACGNWAETPLQYCSHIPAQKGMKIRRKTASGEQEEVMVYEKCIGLSFFENSLLVEEPADPTAYFLGVDDRGLQLAAKRKTAGYVIMRGDDDVVVAGPFKFKDQAEAELEAIENAVDPENPEFYHIEREDGKPYTSKRKQGYGETRVPTPVDTLRDDDCPVCGEHDSFDGDVCKVCQYKRPPEEFLDPDLEMAQEVDLRQDEEAAPEEMGMATDPETGQPEMEAGEEGLEPGVDENGLPIEGEEETLGEDELSEVTEDGMPVDPADPDGLEDSVPDEMSPPEAEEGVDPEAEQEGLAEDAQEGEIAGDDEDDQPIDVNGDPEAIAPDPDADEDFSAEFAVQEGQTPTEGVESEEDDSEDDDDFKKKKSHKSGDIAMRPALEILAKQQGDINAIRDGLVAIARAAGIEKQPAIAKLVTAMDDENPAQTGWANPDQWGDSTEAPVDSSEEALGDVDNEERAGGSPDTPEVKSTTNGDPNEVGAESGPGVSGKRKRAMDEKCANEDCDKMAGHDNGKHYSKKAELDDVEEIGSSPEDDTAPDAMEDLEGDYDTTLDEPLDLNEVDVDEAVEGTDDLGEGPRGEPGSGRTETEVRVDDSADGAMNPEYAFDQADGGWENEASKGEGRQIAAMRLSRLRIQAGIEKGDDLALATKIAKSDMTNQAIQAEIEVLAKVATAEKVNQRPARRGKNRGLVPRSASAERVERTTPSFSAPMPKVAHSVSDDEFLFE